MASPPSNSRRSARVRDLRAEVAAQLGAEDVAYIRRLIRIQRWAEVGGRASLFLGFLPPSGWPARRRSRSRRSSTTWRSVTTSCTASTTGRRIPALSSTQFEWDSSCPAKGWQHYHNYLHHTFTNITEKDRDLGYGVIRISGEAPWSPANLGNPLYALGLALIFD